MTTNDIGNLAAGFVLGMIGSALTWLLIARMYRPKFEISQISRSFVGMKPPKEIDYRIKVHNQRSRRAITDLGIHCRVFIQGLNPARDTNLTSFRILVGDGKIFPYLDKGEGRVYRLRLHELDGGRDGRLPEHVLTQIHNGNRTLEQLLRFNGEKAYVRIVVTGADEFSGFRWSNQQMATIDDIVPGVFDEHDTIHIQQDGERFGETPEERKKQPGDCRRTAPGNESGETS